MPLKIIINGAFGRMGQETVTAINNDSELECVATLGRNDNLLVTIKEKHPDIVIDFTTPDAVFHNTKLIIEHHVHPVIGTTGLTATQIQALQEIAKAKKLGGVIAPNFSIAAVLMMRFAKEASKYFHEAEIIELHHPAKKDAPSGTAIKTAAMMKENLQKEIPIHSVRLPGLVANQHVIFGGLAETLTIKHETTHRQCFMPGVVLACKKVTGLSELVYGLEHLL